MAMVISAIAHRIAGGGITTVGYIAGKDLNTSQIHSATIVYGRAILVNALREGQKREFEKRQPEISKSLSVDLANFMKEKAKLKKEENKNEQV